MVLPVLKIFGVQNFHLIEEFQNQEHFIAELERFKAYKSMSADKQGECDMVKRVFSRFATKLTSLEMQSSVISELSNLEFISEEPGLVEPIVWLEDSGSLEEIPEFVVVKPHENSSSVIPSLLGNWKSAASAVDISELAVACVSGATSNVLKGCYSDTFVLKSRMSRWFGQKIELSLGEESNWTRGFLFRRKLPNQLPKVMAV